MNLQELEAQVTHLEDVHEIENLERIYGFYFDSKQTNKILDLFSENAESVEIESHGVYYGKEGVRKMYGLAGGRQLGKAAPLPPPAVRSVARGTVIIQIGGVVHIKPDGKKRHRTLAYLAGRELPPGREQRAVLAARLL